MRILQFVLWLPLYALSILVAIRFMKDYVGKTYMVPACVLDKQTYADQNIRTGRVQTKFIVAFRCEKTGKVLRFYTSLWVYDSLQIGETGTLRYRGARLIDFT